jgi:hypothetical protein
MSNKGKPAAAAATSSNLSEADKARIAKNALATAEKRATKKAEREAARAAGADDAKTPRDRFTSVGINRVNNVIHALEVLENVADLSTYEYTRDEANKLFSALDKSLATVKTRFNDALDGKVTKKVKEGFSL